MTILFTRSNNQNESMAKNKIKPKIKSIRKSSQIKKNSIVGLVRLDLVLEKKFNYSWVDFISTKKNNPRPK